MSRTPSCHHVFRPDELTRCDAIFGCSLISFAEVAHQSNYRRPVMTEDNVIVIKNGRCVRHSSSRPLASS